jgi:hypothetical protein
VLVAILLTELKFNCEHLMHKNIILLVVYGKLCGSTCHINMTVTLKELSL